MIIIIMVTKCWPPPGNNGYRIRRFDFISRRSVYGYQRHRIGYDNYCMTRTERSEYFLSLFAGGYNVIDDTDKH